MGEKGFSADVIASMSLPQINAHLSGGPEVPIADEIAERNDTARRKMFDQVCAANSLSVLQLIGQPLDRTKKQIVAISPAAGGGDDPWRDLAESLRQYAAGQ